MISKDWENEICELMRKRQYQKALQRLNEAATEQPLAAAVLRVSLYIEQHQLQEAADALTVLRQLEPEGIPARFYALRISFEQGERVEILSGLRDLLQEENASPYEEQLYNLMGQCYHYLGDSINSTESYLNAARCADTQALRQLEYSNYLFNLHYRTDLSLEDERAAALAYDGIAKQTVFLHRHPDQADRKLRIGYISPDFRHHVVLNFVWSLLTRFDRDRYEVYVYANGPEDAYSRKIAAIVTKWTNILPLKSDEAARMIYQDDIDILVDFSGHTKSNCLPILAYRPAPVQICGIGYWASTGLATVDYFLGDMILDEGMASQAFTEHLLQLSASHFCYTPLQSDPAAEITASQQNQYITFGSFNDFSKVNDDVLYAWAAILNRLPSSHLFLKADVFAHESSRNYTLKRMQQAGIPLKRVKYEGLSEDYLSAYQQIDIALDTFPYPGGGTTCDALYMGVPVISLAGSSHGSRFGKSILHNIGLDELCTASVGQYIDAAVALAGDIELLRELHHSLRGMMRRSPLMDSKRYQDEMYHLYAQVWQGYCRQGWLQSHEDIHSVMDCWYRYCQQGDTKQALAAADKMMALKPDDPVLLEKLVEFYLDSGDTHQAAYALQLLEQDQQLGVYPHILLAECRRQEGKIEEALAILHQSGLTDHELLDWQAGLKHHILAESYKQIGNRKAAAAEYLLSSNKKTREQGKAAEYSNYLLNLQYQETDEVCLYQAAEGYRKLQAGVPVYSHRIDKHRHERIRVGYVSADFRRHIVACFSQVFVRFCDKYRFEVFMYARCEEDDISTLFRDQAEHWQNVKDQTDASIANMIFTDEIDILVDLSGHTGHNNMGVMARKPAPIQISGIGYFATTGLKTIDYFFVDRYTASTQEQKFFSETLLPLPHSHLCYLPLPGAPAYVAPAAFQQNGYITFGCFNQYDKITDEILTVWNRILQRVPESRLLLKAAVFDDVHRREKEVVRLKKIGFAEHQLELQGYSAEYLTAYLDVDIALDTYPYPGGGTTCDALYMGVPVITRQGRHHHERFGYSLLMNLGQMECCADSWDDYVEKAVSLAENRDKLMDMHLTLRRSMQQSAISDGNLYMDDLEQAYTTVFVRWLTENGEGLPVRIKEWTSSLAQGLTDENWEQVIRSGTWLLSAGIRQQSILVNIAMAYYELSDYAHIVSWIGRNRPSESELQANLEYRYALALNQIKQWKKSFVVCQEYLQSGKRIDAIHQWGFYNLVAVDGYLIGDKDSSNYYYEAYRRSNTLKDRCESYSSYLLTYNCMLIDESWLYKKHLVYDKLFEGIKPYKHRRNHHLHEKLRIGYISPDIRRHVMFDFMLPLLTNLSGKQDVYVYSLSKKQDEYTEVVKNLSEHWYDVSSLEYSEIAQLIYEDEIDILVDLAGHSAYGGLPVLAWKPSPIQVSGLGYMATTGLSTVDYYLTDSYVDPVGMNEKFFTEKFIRLTSQFCFNGYSNQPVSGGAPCKNRGWLLFGVFNMSRKYTNEMLLAWKEILQCVPKSKLLLKCQAFCDLQMVDYWYKQLKEMGFEMDRIIFEPGTREYLNRYLDVDIALDTYPYPGGGTTCDALFMGVPVIARYGTRHSSRFTYSILQNIGLGELASESVQDYVSKAVSLAQDWELLDMLHRKLRAMMKSSPVMDSDAYMRELETKYQQVWSIYWEAMEDS